MWKRIQFILSAFTKYEIPLKLKSFIEIASYEEKVLFQQRSIAYYQ